MFLSNHTFFFIFRFPTLIMSISAIGFAPLLIMSLIIPPTPVAAPLNGSMAEGWLWLSTFITTAHPSPISTAPASCQSFMPIITLGLSMEKLFKKILDDL
uniref:Uncharacterized protein ORF-c08_021 n=1 Tax=Saccharolobus solfataricus TaxID=2287 RepID=Q9UX22_SACSO|nr:hypothetical protein [Saccharolobus solfataricus P2]